MLPWSDTLDQSMKAVSIRYVRMVEHRTPLLVTALVLQSTLESCVKVSLVKHAALHYASDVHNFGRVLDPLSTH